MKKYSLTIICSTLLIVFCFVGNLYAQNAQRTSKEISQFSNGEIICSSNGQLMGGRLYTSRSAYDPTVIGIYQKAATNPSTSAYIYVSPIKTHGIVYVKYNSENGAIKKGDPVTSSSETGVAMKATKSGMILGVALEDASASTGLVKIRILIQYLK